MMSGSIKGLLIKDFNLMKNQKMFFIIVLLVFAVLLPTYDNPAFCVGYVTITFSFFTLSTLSYDEYENGAAYLFTLPVSRKDYVSEKYVFGFLISTLPCILTNVAFYLVAAAKGNRTDITEYFFVTVMILLIAYLILALEIPLQLKFGQTKSRMAVMVSTGGIIIVIFLLSWLKDIAGIDVQAMISRVSSLGKGIIAAIGVAVFVALMWISYRISCDVVEKKQF